MPVLDVAETPSTKTDIRPSVVLAHKMTGSSHSCDPNENWAKPFHQSPAQGSGTRPSSES